ncbi:phosphatidylinositol mannoside acyltransferase [Corynebacterium sp. CNCTC7651]|uniref:phosphatidylinositol mannoside acyltransferase n=1 Tax=Corynebacterium sp. CNCTC7651 TaxID=2815361 RepID=UPI001F003996|nr:phosphatidylinositol mannoside acyltransferase [Corynebacterium sp. CNCTC7651]UIZ91356.1 phosphatidylinositol mannoside acyltransferase [Corynebacterium sp. CNCTC7651]
MGNSIRETLTAYGYIAGWKIIGALPPGVTWPLFRAGADRMSDDGKGMEMLRRNLTRVVGPEHVTQELVRDAVRSYARYWLEAFRLPRIAEDEDLLARYAAGVEGLEYLEAGLAKGKGVVLTLPHSGNWDFAGLFLAKHYGGFATVAERLKPEALFDAFVEYRESMGFEVLPLTGGERPPFERLREVLEDGGIVCLMGERDMGGRGVPVTFFGEETTFPVGPAKLAMDTGAELFVVHSWYTDSQDGRDEPRRKNRPGWGLKVDPAIEVTDLASTVQRVADGFAANIAAHPGDWHMLQPLWPADRPQRPRRKRPGQQGR